MIIVLRCTILDNPCVAEPVILSVNAFIDNHLAVAACMSNNAVISCKRLASIVI